MLNHVRLFVIPWTVACQAPLSMKSSSQEYCSGLLFPTPGNLPEPGIQMRLLHILHWQADSLLLYHLGSSVHHYHCYLPGGQWTVTTVNWSLLGSTLSSFWKFSYMLDRRGGARARDWCRDWLKPGWPFPSCTEPSMLWGLNSLIKNWGNGPGDCQKF